MNSVILRTILVLIAFFSAIAPSLAVGTARKVYSMQERETEEARIRKDIEAKLDWQNRTKETLDDYDDEHRLLYSKLNESILLRSSTSERFGIYESFDQRGYKRFEIRFHKKNKVTDRFLSGRVFCDAIALSAEKVATEYVLFREVCYRNNNPTQTLYVFDYHSRNLYWLYSDEVTYTKKPVATHKNGTYRVRWDVKTVGTEKNRTIVRNFFLVRTNGSNWEARRLPPINDEADDIAAEEKISVDEKYDLPAFVAAWGK